MKQSQNSVINTLYLEGGRHHTILPLQMFGQRWGALAFTIFGNTAKGLVNKTYLALNCFAKSGSATGNT
ncbi:hypothetical protein JCM19236_3848 [Vibrio sp. JCM 19236]|nr:hypothetical protein JCM19236_3848 [Vibrio sp. JCM 19236]